MIFGPGTTVTITMTSPAESPVDCPIEPNGDMNVNGDMYKYHAGPPEDYRFRKNQQPGKGWHTLSFDTDGDVIRHFYPVETGTKIHTGDGGWTAVA